MSKIARIIRVLFTTSSLCFLFFAVAQINYPAHVITLSKGRPINPSLFGLPLFETAETTRSGRLLSLCVSIRVAATGKAIREILGTSTPEWLEFQPFTQLFTRIFVSVEPFSERDMIHPKSAVFWRMVKERSFSRKRMRNEECLPILKKTCVDFVVFEVRR
jgi:hypothetical protein